MRKITPKQYAISLYESIAGKNQAECAAAIRNFVYLLAIHKRLSQSEKILTAFRSYLNEQEGIVEVTATTTEPISIDMQQRIIKTLEKSLEKKVELENTVDQSIIGGMILSYDDTVADGSVRNKLNILAEHLKQ